MIRETWRMTKAHASTLTLILCIAIIGQIATLSQKPLIYFAGDSVSYLEAASTIATKLDFSQSLRTLGYPALLAGLFNAGGWQDYTLIVSTHATAL